MPTINNIVLSATKRTNTGNSWEIAVDYNATFSAVEVGERFKDGFILWEEDPIRDDKLSTLVGGGDITPRNAGTVPRRLSARFSGNTLNTEIGEEELYAVVHLQNVDRGTEIKGKSPILKLDP
jgi:hypothetical protein